MSENFYAVEKIVRREIRHGKVCFINSVIEHVIFHFFFIISKVYFLLKWENYSKSKNTWEPEDNLHECQDIIEEFDSKQFRRILGKNV